MLSETFRKNIRIRTNGWNLVRLSDCTDFLIEKIIRRIDAKNLVGLSQERQTVLHSVYAKSKHSLAKSYRID